MRRNRTNVLAFAAAFAALPATARAQASSDPQARPRMLAEGAAITDVIDAVDLGSMWSLRFTAGYSSSTRRATLQRERSTITTGMMTAPAPAGITEFDTVARYSQVTQRLNLGLELAIFHDLSAFVGLPIIVSDSREFTGHGDVTTAQSNQRLSDGFSVNGTPTQLFQIPFRSPERSGIDYIRLGFNWNILNQARDPHLPTWLVRFEWRPPVGSQLRPCSVDPSSMERYCPFEDPDDPATPTRETDPYPGAYDPPESTNWNTMGAPARRRAPSSMGADPGISRRVHGLYLQTVVSRRIGYVEPYLGLDAMIEIPERNIAFRFGDTPYGQLSNIPPIRGSLVAGTEIVPWENRETWQRFVVDLRVRAQYFSQGRDYTPLFDALGSSNSLPLTQASYAINDIDDRRRPIYFAGTTSTHSHGRLTGQVGLGIQAAKFLRFSFGGAVSYTTPHLMTATDACNPNEQPGNNSALRGGCVGNAAPDPLHRPVIDLPGQRFRFIEDFTFDLWVNVSLTPRF